MAARFTQVARGEVCSALSAGVVDDAGTPLVSTYGAKLQETRKTILLTGHFKGVPGPMMNIEVFAALPQHTRIILNEEAVRTGTFMTNPVSNGQEELIAKSVAEGVTFSRDVGVAGFELATTDVYTQFPDWSDGLCAPVRKLPDTRARAPCSGP